ncbi:hypothetical protein J4401_06755 [Candidatus Woesearchaeota archaeon]|nr:hypothetical protein [Candidatus Woesearchaeota archaeon]
MKWIEYARGEIPPFTVGLIVFGMLKYSGELIGSPFREVIHSHYDKRTRWGWKKRDVSEIGRHLLNKFSDKEKYSGYLSKYASVITESSIASGSIINSDISVLDKDMLLKRYEEFVLSNMRFHALTMDIDVIDLILEERMMAKIREIITDERELSKAYALITTPSTLSYTAREEIAILETASKKASKKEFMDCIHELSREFWWTSLGWNFGKIKEVQYFLDAATLKKNEAESKLNKKKKLHRETEDAKKKLFEKLGFDKDFMFLHQIFKAF